MLEGYNVYGVICGTWAEACEVAGIETPAQLAAEARCEADDDAIDEQDRIEAQGPTFGRFGRCDLDIPF